MSRGLIPPNMTDLTSFNVNVEGQPEVQWQPIYDYQAYPNAGFTGETLFFQVPAGQAAKTVEDTNMTAQGRLPTPVNMVVTALEIYFTPGNVISATGAIVARNWNDVNAFNRGRMSFRFRIGDKDYAQEAPLNVLPQVFGLGGGAALSDTTTAAASRVTVIDYARAVGPVYQVVPMRLISNQQFFAAINSPAVVALPSGVDGRFGVRAQGFRFRLAQ